MKYRSHSPARTGGHHAIPLLVVLLAILAVPATAACQADPGWIVFSSNRDDATDDKTMQTDIYAMRPDGSEVRRLTEDPASDWAPSLSPDGQTVVFLSDRSPGRGMYVVGIDGTGHTRLTDAINGSHPTWSPAGDRIVFVSDQDGTTELYTIRPDGSEMTRLTDNDVGESDPVWSPDGTMIAYSVFQMPSANDLFVMNADGTGARQLTDNSDLNVAPAWSPDGKQLLYTAWSSDAIEPGQPFQFMTLVASEKALAISREMGVIDFTASLHIVDVDGTNGRPLIEDQENNWTGAWSSDGDRIVFVSDRDGDCDIYSMNPDGTELANLTNDDEDDYTPDW